MQKRRIYLLLVANTFVLFGAVWVLVPMNNQGLGIVGIMMMIMMLLPGLIINITTRKWTIKVVGLEQELIQTNKNLVDLQDKYNDVTTLDELTGCANKRHFLEVLGQHKAMSERGTYQFTVAVTQVDQFSDIVAKQGLKRGNEILQLFSRIVKAALREVDVIARLEGEKFALLLSGCTEEDALRTIDRISELVGQIQINDEDDIKITASGGITSFHGTESPPEIIDNADKALQFAVEQGEGRVAGYNSTEKK